MASDNREDIRKRIASSFVTDTETNDLIIKMVNLLPVAVSSTIDLSKMNIAQGEEANLIVMNGDLDDKSVTPAESAITVSEVLDYQLPAYSLSVIRIKRKELSE